MTLQIVLAITGCVALLIGLFGGGVKAKEIEIPKIRIGPRILSSLAGIMLIGLAIRLPAFAQAEPTPIPQGDAASPVVETPTEPPILAEPHTELIPFRSPDDPSRLNPILGWQPGYSSANAYKLSSSSNALTLIAGGDTHQWADLDSQPAVSYPMQGNFEAQVKVVFYPMWGHELVALGVRSSQDRTTWLRLGGVYAAFTEGSEPEYHIVLEFDDQGRPGRIKTSPSPTSAVHVKIERQGSVFNFFYSADGVNWTALITGYVSAMPVNVEIFLTVGSWGPKGISAEFHDLTVLRK